MRNGLSYFYAPSVTRYGAKMMIIFNKNKCFAENFLYFVENSLEKRIIPQDRHIFLFCQSEIVTDAVFIFVARNEHHLL